MRSKSSILHLIRFSENITSVLNFFVILNNVKKRSSLAEGKSNLPRISTLNPAVKIQHQITDVNTLSISALTIYNEGAIALFGTFHYLCSMVAKIFIPAGIIVYPCKEKTLPLQG